MVFGAFRGPVWVPGVFMRDGTAQNARNYLVFRVLFHKVKKRETGSPQNLNEKEKPTARAVLL